MAGFQVKKIGNKTRRASLLQAMKSLPFFLTCNFQVSKALGANTKFPSLSPLERSLNVLGALAGSLHYTPTLALNSTPIRGGAHTSPQCPPLSPRRRPERDDGRRREREKMGGHNMRRGTGAHPEVLILGLHVTPVPQAAPLELVALLFQARVFSPDCSQEPSKGLAVREKQSSTLPPQERYQALL